MSAPKNIITIFTCGIIFGIAISPFLNSKPQNFILSPTQDLFAKEIVSQNKIDKKPELISNNKLKELFLSYDQEQLSLTKTHQVLGVNTTPVHEGVPKKTTAFLVNTHKTIALFGDSMVDTMETSAPYLHKELVKIYPNIKFDILNYGIGAQSVTKGLSRLNENLNYKDRQYLPILNSGADIFIVESFAYNPMDDIGEYENNMRLLLEKFIATGKPIYFLATIAPLKTNFGKGPGGVNWDNDSAWTHATKINSYLEKGLSIAKSYNLPIIDCYHSSIQSNGEGMSSYVNKHDGIHPSQSGHQYIASQISQSIDF